MMARAIVIVSDSRPIDTGYHHFGKLKVDDQHPTTSGNALFLVVFNHMALTAN